jgi:hypothetical protein
MAYRTDKRKTETSNNRCKYEREKRKKEGSKGTKEETEKLKKEHTERK